MVGPQPGEPSFDGQTVTKRVLAGRAGARPRRAAVDSGLVIVSSHDDDYPITVALCGSAVAVCVSRESAGP